LTSEQREFGDIPSLLSQLMTSGETPEIQELVASIIQAILDPEISLLPVPGELINFWEKRKREHFRFTFLRGAF
jgi:hypothetical protein